MANRLIAWPSMRATPTTYKVSVASYNIRTEIGKPVVNEFSGLPKYPDLPISRIKAVPFRTSRYPIKPSQLLINVLAVPEITK